MTKILSLCIGKRIIKSDNAIHTQSRFTTSYSGTAGDNLQYVRISHIST